ncbi:MAG: zinc ribbon domain-containing protein [Sphingobacteriales bacterium]|nr:zinc ribbon domain-containing protein [Sphingobacteriales bacterium]
MNPLTFLFPFLKKINDGFFIKKSTSSIVSVIGWIILIISSIGSLIFLIKGLDTDNITIGLVISIILASALFFILGIFIFQIHAYHSAEIKQLPKSPFTVTPIISILLKLTGEIIALYIFLIGVVSFVALLFIGNTYILNGFLGELGGLSRELSGYLGGPVMVACGLLFISFLSALFMLMIFYYFSEKVLVSTDIATNIRRMLNNSEQITNIEIIEATDNTKVPTPRTCPSCKEIINPNDIFCENCGNKLK